MENENTESINKGMLIQIPIEDEVRQAFIDYSMSVITSRAVPDARDGLKPVHRRIIYDMNKQGLRYSGKTRKCATIVGDVLGHYHPHGDASVYDALVRLGQDFSQRYIVVEPGGNFGTIAGDPPAAYRYTEAKMAKIAEEMVADINKETVDMMPNFDDTTTEPTVLPTKFPFLLCNGSMGIAVGMATNMPPHNLREVGAAINAYIDNQEITADELMKHIKGPDFPTGGIIFGKKGIAEAYKTGRGKILVRGKFSVEVAKSGAESIVFTEVPYGVNTRNLCEKIGALARDKAIEGISAINDESSDRAGMRIVIHLKRGAVTKLVVNQLFAKTELQSSFGVINLALVKGRPQVLTLKQLIQQFVDHRDDVITRRTKYDLKVAKHDEHILSAKIIAVDAVDEVVKIIRGSNDEPEAKVNLMNRFGFDDEQAQAIVDLRLGVLTSLRIDELKKKMEELKALIAYLEDLLAHHEKILALIKEETNSLVEKFGDERKTQIVSGEVETVSVEDMIKEEDMVVMISKLGYMKRVSVTQYKKQGRGGTGSNSATLVEDDYINQVFIGSTHDHLVFITSLGKTYWIKIHEIPEATKNSRGTHIKSMIMIGADEEITAVVALREFSEDQFLFMTTAEGVVKKVQTSEFANAKTRGIIGLKLKDGDRLISAIPTDGNSEVLLVTRRGRALRFNEKAVRQMGRASAGIRGIKLQEGDEVAGAIKVVGGENILLLTEKGFGKRVKFEMFNLHGRGTGGQRIFGGTDERGEIIGLITVKDNDEVVCMTSQGKTLRVLASTIALMGVAAKGVKIVKISEPDFLVGIDKVSNEEKKTENKPTKNLGVFEYSADESLVDEVEAEVDEDFIDDDTDATDGSIDEI